MDTKLPTFGAKTWSCICPWTLYVPRNSQFSSLSENCSRLGTDYVRGQMSEHIFEPNRGYCLNVQRGSKLKKAIK